MSSIGTAGAIGNGLSGAQLKVTPEELYRQSTSVSNGVRTIRNSFDRMSGKVSATSSYWTGEAADGFRSTYSGYTDEINEIIARLTEHISELNTMAGVYEEAEDEAQELIASLPDDVII